MASAAEKWQKRSLATLGAQTMHLKGSADTRYTFTRQFLEASAIFVRRVREIENSPAAISADPAMVCEHRGLVCAVIMQCAAALETEAHETRKHGPGANLGSYPTDVQARQFLQPFADVVDKQNTLKRFNLILNILRRERLEEGSKPYQHAELVVRLRNEIVHYKSQWGAEMEPKKLFRSLQSLKHKAPPFTNSNMNFFPHRCLSADCAAWAQQSILTFLEAFYESLGVPSQFQDDRSRLMP